MDSLLDDAPCGFLVFSEAGLITAVNHTLEYWLGYERGELVGKKFDSLMRISGRIFCQTHLFPLLKLQGEATEIFLGLNSKDKVEIPVLLNAKRRSVDDAVGFHCVLMPVHQRRKFEDELLSSRNIAQDANLTNRAFQQATKDLEESKQDLDVRISDLSALHDDLARFGKVISHDMQEPVRKIAMFSDMILREAATSPGEGMRFAAQRISSATVTLRALIASLEQYVSIDTYSAPLIICDLNAIISRVETKIRAENPQVQFTLIHNNLPSALGYPTMLEMLFGHLISNAIQFRKADGDDLKIDIAGDIIQHNSYRSLPNKYRYTDFVRITLADNGQGFDEQYNEYVFGLFKKTQTSSDGLGFGLALCRKIVSKHRGTITALSKPGEGTTITLMLPAAIGSDRTEHAGFR